MKLGSVKKIKNWIVQNLGGIPSSMAAQAVHEQHATSN
jgi:hypothetical protein